ncbi:MAG: hypothetical protein ACTSVI_12600 [Promethearchaeota archaeon]
MRSRHFKRLALMTITLFQYQNESFFFLEKTTFREESNRLPSINLLTLKSSWVGLRSLDEHDGFKFSPALEFARLAQLDQLI